MMSIDCARARTWMDRRAAGLNPADRLRLEDHLATCGACVQQSQALHAIQAVILDHTLVPSEAAQRRVIARAIVEARTATQVASSANNGLSSRWAVPALAVACTLLVALGVWRLRADDTRGHTTIAAVSTQRADAAATAEQLLIADAAGHATVEGAELTLDPTARAWWSASTATLRLESGRLSAHVQPRHGLSPFVVRAPDFAVVVIGTRFVVAQDNVEVTEGSVRVEQAKRAAVHVRAGERWDRMSGRVNVVHEAASVAVIDRDDDDSHKQTQAKPLDLLTQARTRLARGEIDVARHAIDRAQSLKLTRTLRAEAETLLAECDQVEGKLSAAIERYRKIGASYRDLGAGDNAAYAAARLVLSRHDDARARTLLEDYVRLYPNGRFRTDAQAALNRLSGAHADQR